MGRSKNGFNKGGYFWQTKSRRNNHPSLPNDIRCIIVGLSGSGKTSQLFKMLLKGGIIDYDSILVYGRSIHQDCYEILDNSFNSGLTKKDVETMFLNQHKIRDVDKYIENLSSKEPEITCSMSSDDRDIPDPAEIDRDSLPLAVFDDVLDSPQSKLKSWFTRGRHNHAPCIYITQDFFKIDKGEIRNNANCFILLRNNNEMDTVNFHKRHCGNVSLDWFMNYLRNCWSIPYGYALINMESQKKYHASPF